MGFTDKEPLEKLMRQVSVRGSPEPVPGFFQRVLSWEPVSRSPEQEFICTASHVRFSTDEEFTRRLFPGGWIDFETGH